MVPVDIIHEINIPRQGNSQGSKPKHHDSWLINMFMVTLFCSVRIAYTFSLAFQVTLKERYSKQNQILSKLPGGVALLLPFSSQLRCIMTAEFSVSLENPG